MSKPRIIKSYEKLSDEMLDQIKLAYPAGFTNHYINFTGIDGKLAKGLPFETEEYMYIIKMSNEAETLADKFTESATSENEGDDDFDYDESDDLEAGDGDVNDIAALVDNNDAPEEAEY